MACPSVVRGRRGGAGFVCHGMGSHRSRLHDSSSLRPSPSRNAQLIAGHCQYMFSSPAWDLRPLLHAAPADQGLKLRSAGRCNLRATACSGVQCLLVPLTLSALPIVLFHVSPTHFTLCLQALSGTLYCGGLSGSVATLLAVGMIMALLEPGFAVFQGRRRRGAPPTPGGCSSIPLACWQRGD